MYRFWAWRQTSGGNYRLMGAPTRHTMSLRSCPKEAMSYYGRSRGLSHRKRASLSIIASGFCLQCLGTLPYGAQTPRDTDFDELAVSGKRRQCLVSVVYGPHPIDGTHPTANRVRWRTREVSRGRVCAPSAARVARSITHLVIQAVGPRGKETHRTRDGREHARCRSWACDARKNSGLVSRRTAFVVDQALVCL